MSSVTQDVVRTKIPARMDRLPWARWHWLVLFALGSVWILDGLEVTIKGTVGPALKESLGFTTFAVAGLASIYLLGAVLGALFWAYLTDRYGRKKLLIATILTYIVGVLGTSTAGLVGGDTVAYIWFGAFRFLTGFGIGGEYAAINSAIDELIPARVRGWVDLVINGSWWLGTAAAALLGTLYLNIFALDIAWRVAFATGLVLGIGVLMLRLFVPESPRWLMTHGYEDEAEATLRDIEEQVKEQTDTDELPEPSDDEAIELRQRKAMGFITLGRSVFKLYPNRSIAGGSILLTQAFLYNAIFFTFGLMLTTYFGVATESVGWFLLPFAVGNFLGPLILGRFFDTRGRRTMIPLTFWMAGGLTIVTGLLFATNIIASAFLLTLFWVVIFFFASAGASAGYLTISETFPLEIRAMAIAFFYALATGIGGILGPILYGALISPDNRWTMFYGYLIGGLLMIFGGAMHRKFGVEAAQMSLEDITKPLSAADAEGEDDTPSYEGPAGVDPTDPESVRDFQRDHNLDPDGVIGPETLGAILARRSQDSDSAPGVELIDITDLDEVRAFQQTFGLEEDGVIGPETMGALRAAERRILLDPADPDAIKRFQRTHGLDEDGVIGPKTQAAMRAIASERGEGESAKSYVLDVDPLDPESIKAFQRLCGLDDDAVIGPQTRGAMKLEYGRRARTYMDPADAESVKAFQREHGLTEDGVIGPQTQARLGAVRAHRDSGEALRRKRREERERLFVFDPLDAESVRRFQQQHGLKADGCIGAETRRVLRRRTHLLSGVDVTDPDDVKRFQREHGLVEDGVVGAQTQGAMQALRADQDPTGIAEEDEEQREEADDEAQHRNILDFDPADAAAVRRFQEEHGIEPADGIIGPRTQAALTAVLRERALAASQDEPPRPERERRFHRRLPSMGAGFKAASAPIGEDREFDRELDQIMRALREREPMSRRDLREAVGAKRWGPGRFSYILNTAVEEGVLKQTGRDRYVRARTTTSSEPRTKSGVGVREGA